MNKEPEVSAGVAAALDRIQSDRHGGLTDLRLMAENGDQHAIIYLGMYLSEDEDPSQEAIDWLEKAQSLGSADAAWNLAMISRSRGDDDATKLWLKRAATLGESDAIEIVEKGRNLEDVLSKYCD